MKTCGKCNQEKELSEFHKNSRKKDGLQSWCKKCKNGHHQDYYEQNKSVWNERNRKFEASLRAWYQELKSQPCTDCGVSYPHYVMDFDHVETKLFDISLGVSHCYPREKILNEIKKCQLVCSNCHRIRTWDRRHAGMV